MGIRQRLIAERRQEMSNAPLLMTEEFWANSQLSIARYYGEITFGGRKYIIVDKHGRDIYELSAIAEREGRDKAIEPGEPADLILSTLRFAYRKLGRDRIIELIKDGKTEDEIKALAKKGGDK